MLIKEKKIYIITPNVIWEEASPLGNLFEPTIRVDPIWQTAPLVAIIRLGWK
jgi:hypothetical protein